MPIMDGIQATKEIRRLEEAEHKSFALVAPRPENGYSPSSSTPVEPRPAITPFHSSVIIVALTASTLQSDRVAALAAGCNDFLTKPVTLVWLEKKIIEWGAYDSQNGTANKWCFLGSIKALQMWADPDISPVFEQGQAAQTRAIAKNLHIPKRVWPEKPLQSHIDPAGPQSVNGPSTIPATTSKIVSPLGSLPATENAQPTSTHQVDNCPQSCCSQAPH
jgi:osomolarity two-component system response regulator SSK1